jgi:hypothetical protein
LAISFSLKKTSARLTEFIHCEQGGTAFLLEVLNRIGWDALGQQLFVEFVVGTPDRNISWPIGMTPSAAKELLIALQTCLEDKAGEEDSMQ